MKRPDKNTLVTVVGTYVNLGDNMSFNWENYAADMDAYCDFLEDRNRLLKEYNDLLGESLDAVFPIAAVHGYKETDKRIEKGEMLRTKLKTNNYDQIRS